MSYNQWQWACLCWGEDFSHFMRSSAFIIRVLNPIYFPIQLWQSFPNCILCNFVLYLKLSYVNYLSHGSEKHFRESNRWSHPKWSNNCNASLWFIKWSQQYLFEFSFCRTYSHHIRQMPFYECLVVTIYLIRNFIIKLLTGNEERVESSFNCDNASTL